MEIDAAIDALSDALAARGGDVIVPPAAPPDLSALNDAIAPLTLPAELVRFWERVDAAAIGFSEGLDYLTPEWSLEARQFERELDRDLEFLTTPGNLLPIARKGLGVLAMELDHPTEGPGGALFEYWHDDSSAELVEHSLADRILWQAALVRADPAPKFVDRGGLRQLWLSDEAEAEVARPRPKAHPAYGTTTSFIREFDDWPDRWLRASGYDARPRPSAGS